jgi:hypothetical protein
MEKYFEKLANTTASRLVSHALRASGAWPSIGAYSMPW